MSNGDRPTPLPVILSNIPGHLTARDQFLVWSYTLVEEPGKLAKWDKPPKDARNGAAGSSTNRATWSSFADASAVYTGGECDGIGFALAHDDIFFAMDLDHCIVDGQLSTLAQSIVDRTSKQMYWERSPSGTGLRGIGIGTLPAGRRKNNVFEVYSEGRYVTLTGQTIEGYTGLSANRITLDATGIVAEIHQEQFGEQSQRDRQERERSTPVGDDMEIIDRCRRFKSGPKFERLMAGSTADYGGDDSAADAGLIEYLLFANGGDIEQTVRIASTSMLWREKWESRRNDTDYIHYTAERILAKMTSFYTPGSRTYAEDDSDDANDAESTGGSDGNGSRKKPSQATLLVQLAIDNGAELFHDPNSQPFVSILVNGHREIWPVRSSGFRTYLQRSYYQAHRGAAGAAAVQDALSTLEGMALFEGEERKVSVRTTADDDGAIYIDLGDEDWRAVKLTPDGWHVVADAPVAFQRSKTTRALPYPEAGGSLSDLGDYLNFTEDTRGNDFLLVVGFMIVALLPTGPYPILDFTGEQGGGKTTASRVIRRLIDPRQVEVASFPRDDGDLATVAANTHLLAFDNVSHISDDNADKLCRLSTGGGFHKRKLYSDDEEHAVDVVRPSILNGIPDLATRPDLADRTLAIELPSFRGKTRQPEMLFWLAFDHAAPKLFGALLDALVIALRNLPFIQRDDLPRMADFARLGEAILPALGRESGAFLAAMRSNAQRQNLIILEAYPEMAELLLWASGWSNDERATTASGLLATLNERVSPEIRKSSSWPKSVKALSTNLRRVKPNLYAAGLSIEFERDMNQRRIRFRRVTPETIGEEPSYSSYPSSEQTEHDANDASTLFVSGAQGGEKPSSGSRTSWWCECGTNNAGYLDACLKCRKSRPREAA